MSVGITREMVQQALYEHIKLRPPWPAEPSATWYEERRQLSRALDEADPGEVPQALVVRLLKGSRYAQEQEAVRALLAAGAQTARQPDTIQEIACPRCGGYPYSRPSCPLCKGTGKVPRNLGQFVEEYLGKSLYFSVSSYNCPALALYGYRNDLELKRAVKRKLGMAKRKASGVKRGPQAPRLTR